MWKGCQPSGGNPNPTFPHDGFATGKEQVGDVTRQAHDASSLSTLLRVLMWVELAQNAMRSLLCRSRPRSAVIDIPSDISQRTAPAGNSGLSHRRELSDRLRSSHLHREE
jgi:hypothetical protein